MKKLLLSLFALVSVLTMGATEAVFDFTNPEALTPPVTRSADPSTGVDVAGTTFTNNGVSINCDKGTSSYVRVWTGSEAKGKPVDIRFYNGGIMTVTAPTGENITSVVMTGAKLGGFSVTDGTYDNGTWTGNANSVVLTGTATTNINTITVTTVPAGTIVVAAPKATPGADYYYNGINAPVEVELSCATEGAKIYYQLGDAAYAEYTAPLNLTATTTLKAYAELEGTKSEVSEYLYNISDPVSVANSKEAIALASATTVVKFTSPVTVMYQNGKYTYAKDDSGFLHIYGEIPTYASGDVIPAGFAGTMKIYNNLYELDTKIGSNFASATFAAATENVGAVAPTPAEIGEIDATRQNEYVRFSKVTFDATAKTITNGEDILPVYYRFTDVTAPESGEYDIEGIVSVYKTTVQIFPTTFATSGVEGVEAKNEAKVIAADGAIYVIGAKNVAIYNASGALVSTKANAELAAGLYIVKADNTVSKVVVK